MSAASNARGATSARDKRRRPGKPISVDQKRFEIGRNTGYVQRTNTNICTRNARLFFLFRWIWDVTTVPREVIEIWDSLTIAHNEFLYRPGQSKDDIGAVNTMVSGAVGGICLWTAIFPADVIKSRIQVSGSTKGMLEVGLDIFRKEGGLALYNGLTPTVLRTIPATSVLFLFYEYTKKILEPIFIT